MNYSRTKAGYGIVDTAGYSNITIQNLTLTQENASVTNSHGIYFKNVANSKMENISITTQGSSSAGIYLNSSGSSTFSNFNITTSNISAHGIYTYLSNSNYFSGFNIIASGRNSNGIYITSSNNNSYYNSNISTSGISAHGIYLNGDYNNFSNIDSTVLSGNGIYLKSANSNIINDSSIVSKSSNDYYLQNTGTINSFRNTNFTTRKVYLYDNSSSFNYSNETNNGIWLNTIQIISPSSTLAITRTLTNWTRTNISWQEKLTASRRLSYSMSGLPADTNYSVWNGSAIDYNLTTDGNGNLPVFKINFSTSAKMIRVISAGNITPITPYITSWRNDKTNNNSLILAVNTSEAVNFNAAANQTITTWNWYQDGVSQNDNNDNFTASWNTAGTKTVQVNATNSNGTSNTITWIVTVLIQPEVYIPSSPTNINSTTGNFWINTTWQADSGNTTDSYNVSVNGTWYNGTTNTYYNNTVGPHGWSNITVWAYNSSGAGSLSAGSISQNAQVPNNPPVQVQIGNKNVTAGDLLTFTVSTTDADNDTITYGTNATKGTLNPATGVYSWQTTSSDAGVYVLYFNSSDSYGGVASETITITVNSVLLSIASSSPVTDPSTMVGASQTFEITLNRTANVTWYVNGSTVQTNSNVISTNYTNSTAGAGVYNITATASDVFGSASRIWNWTVIPQPVYNVSGYVFDNYGSGLDGVLVQNGSYQNTTIFSGYYLITGLPNGVYKFNYSRVGFDTGYLEVIISNADNTNTNITIYGTVPPAQVIGFINDTPTQTSINLSWDSIADASYYQVFRNYTSLGYTRNIYWNDTGLTPDTLYEYEVRANDSYNNWGQNSSVLGVTTAIAADTAPPESITDPNTTTGNFFINDTWINPKDADFSHVLFKYSNGTDLQTVMSPFEILNFIWSPHYTQNISAQTVDTSGNINQTKVWFNATIPNNIPAQAAIGNKTVVAGNILTFAVSATDADLDSITYSTDATKGTLNPATGVYSWITTTGDVGTYIWTFSSRDDYGGVASETIAVNVINQGQEVWIKLNNDSGELIVNDSSSLDNGTGLSSATWSIWAMQNKYKLNAGLFGKYQPVAGNRSYIIRTSDVDGISVVLSADGTNTTSYSSNTSRDCGIRNDNEWTLITVTYDGSHIIYYHNGVKCDSDSTTINSLHNASVPLRIGGGNSVFFNGSIDDILMYNQGLPGHQVYRFYQESEHGLAGRQTIPALIYHQVTDPADVSDKISTDNFNQQIAYLHDNNFTTITSENFNQWLKGNFTMPKRPVIIFFDDGWNYTYNNALSTLDKYGYVGVIPVVTNYANFTNDTSYMRWWQLQELQNRGWEIASHSIDHVSMLTLNESDFRNELNLSSIDIERNSGKKPTSFIFPYNYANTTYTTICGEYYDLCWAYGSKDTWPYYNDYSDNGHVYQSLKRITIYNTTTIQTFKDMLVREISTPIGAWPLNEGTGSIAYDSSGNGNNALLNANAIWHNDSTISSAVSSAINPAINPPSSTKKPQKNQQEPPLPPSETLS